MSKEHTDLVNKIIHEGNKIPGVRLWPNKTSFAYVGKGARINTRKGFCIVIKNGHGLRFGLQEGSSDIIGYYKCGENCIPRFVAIEVKTGEDKRKPEQIQFGKVMEEDNCLYGVARCVEDLYTILWGEK